MTSPRRKVQPQLRGEDNHRWIYDPDNKWVPRDMGRVRQLREHLASEHGMNYIEIVRWKLEELSTAHMLAHGVSDRRPERTGF
jgi:hypothetical protein